MMKTDADFRIKVALAMSGCRQLGPYGKRPTATSSKEREIEQTHN